MPVGLSPKEQRQAQAILNLNQTAARRKQAAPVSRPTTTTIQIPQPEETPTPTRPAASTEDPKIKQTRKAITLFQFAEKAGSTTFALGGDMSFNELVIGAFRIVLTKFKGLSGVFLGMFLKPFSFDLNDQKDKLNYYLTIAGIAAAVVPLFLGGLLILLLVTAGFVFYDALGAAGVLGPDLIPLIQGA